MDLSVAGITGDVGVGAVAGFLTGFALKKVMKIAMALIGAYLLSLFWLQQKGVITINTDKLFNLTGNLTSQVVSLSQKAIGILPGTGGVHSRLLPRFPKRLNFSLPLSIHELRASGHSASFTGIGGCPGSHRLGRFLYSAMVARRFGLEELGTANSLLSKAFFIAIPLSFFAVALGKYTSEFLGTRGQDSIRSMTLPSFLLPPLTGLFLLPVNAYLGGIIAASGGEFS